MNETPSSMPTQELYEKVLQRAARTRGGMPPVPPQPPARGSQDSCGEGDQPGDGADDGSLRPQPSQEAERQSVSGRFTTTLHALSSGVAKLAAISPAFTCYASS